MSSPKQIVVKETLAQLRKHQRAAITMIANRIRVIIEFKKHEQTGISKRVVADIVGVNHNSVQTWRRLYEQGGIEAVLSYEKREGRPSSFTREEHEKMEMKLKDPKNGLRGYVELVDWAEQEFKKTFKYNTVLKYSMRHFGSKIKVARKSHVKKDDDAVSTFKKTSVKAASKSATSLRKITKR
jgi:transposase